jgi:cytochrome b subunit of formate dehydrogenase
MLFYNLADYLRKALSGRSRSQTHPEIAQEEASVLRLTPNERIQHAVLTITFVILAYTGFALKFQDAWWATPFNLAGGEAVRKSIHHWTALCLVALGLYHAAYMLGTRRGRDLWRRFLPKLRNLADPLLMLAYNLGIKKTRPQPVYPSFAEKMEYFSLIWGAIVMVATGSFLLFSDYALRYFPLWVTDLATLIHFYEAVLACLAITVWHLYWVIFDPDVYPMNWAWLTGRLLRNENGEKPERDSA